MILSAIKKRVRHCILLICFLAVFAAGYSHTPPSGEEVGFSASKVFADIPLEVLDLIRPSARLDMLDYYEHADSMLSVENALGGESRLEQVTRDYLKVAVTPLSTLEIKLLPLGKNEIVMLLYTTYSDTEISFFDSNLSPLDVSKYLKAPSLKDFFDLRGSKVSEGELEEKIPFTTIQYSTGPGDTPLTATFTTLSTLSQEDRDLLTPLLRAPLSAPWKSKFKFK